MKLRYTGTRTVTFITAGVGEVEPGAVFSVPDEYLKSFVHRTDIEALPPVEDEIPEEKRATTKKKAVVDTEPDPLPETVDPAPAVDTETL